MQTKDASEITVYNESPSEKQPSGNGGGLTRTEKRYVKGSHASVSRLKKNGFDPIDELVKKYRRLEKELDYYEDWRAGRIVPLNLKGLARGYNENAALIHLNIYDKLTKVAEALLRYAYGRVPEGLNLGQSDHKPLTINLSADQKSYEILVARDEQEEDDAYEPGDD
jgi:hypothetical protein